MDQTQAVQVIEQIAGQAAQANVDHANPILGVLIFALGGLAGALFYLPFKRVRTWAWESYWLVYAVFGLVIVPWTITLLTAPNVFKVLKAASASDLVYCYGCGALWGVGGLTWGLMIRYLGVGLGLAIGCGLCSAAGTLIPPIIQGNIHNLYGSAAANVSLLAVVVSLVGIIAVGMAGMSKEKELPEEEKKKAVAEFNFKKGIIVAIFSGLTSSGMSFGLQGGKGIEALALTLSPVSSNTWKGMPVLVVVLLGGFTVNFLWCLFLNFRNGTIKDYIRSDAPMLANIIFAGLAGAIWCSQFICFKTGEPAMGRMSYLGWAVLMASAIMFSTLLGIALGEWRSTSKKTRSFLAIGLVLLLASSLISAWSGYLSQS